MTSNHRDAVALMGLVQIGAIVASVLTSAVILRMAPETRGLLPFLRHRGLWLLIVPALWVLVSLQVRRRETRHPLAFRMVVFLGWASVVALGGILIAALVSPFGHGEM